MHILINHPDNNKLKFLVSCYETRESSARDRIVKESLLMPKEVSAEDFIAVETDLLDLHPSLQDILKKEIKATEEHTIIYRTFLQDGSNKLISQSDLEICALIYDEVDWLAKPKNKILN